MIAALLLSAMVAADGTGNQENPASPAARTAPPVDPWADIDLPGSPSALGAPPAAPVPRVQDPEMVYRQGIASYDRGDYQDAAALLQSVLEPLQLLDPEKIARGHQTLGAARFNLGQRDEAREQFIRLLTLRPAAKLDPLLFPPPMVAFFDAIREQLAARLKKIREQQETLAEQQRQLLLEEQRRKELERRIFVIRTDQNPPFAVNFLPLGAGQFQNGQQTKGLVFAGAQAAGLALNIGGYAAAESLKGDRRYYHEDDVNAARLGMAVQYTGLALAVGAYVWSVFDAWAEWQPVVRSEVRYRGSDPDLPEEFKAEFAGSGSATPLPP